MTVSLMILGLILNNVRWIWRVTVSIKSRYSVPNDLGGLIWNLNGLP